MGPAGAGKTVTSIVKCAFNTLRMPVGRDGVIRATGCVIRDNYRTLYRTTLESWFRIFPRDFPGAKFEGGQDRPAKHTIPFRTPKGQLVVMTVDFYALGDHAIEDLLKGYEPSWGWGNESDLLHERALPFLHSRTGRNPPRSTLRDPDTTIPRQVFGDLNPPDVDHWIYRDCVEEPRAGFKLYQQPSGLSPEAENIKTPTNNKGVSRAYYEEMATTLPERDVIRFVHGRFGYSNDGKPVYQDFNEQRCISRVPLIPRQELPLHGGLDQGLSPALVLFQELPSGQLRFYAEVVPPHGTGPARFAEMVVATLNEPRFRECSVGLLSADPAGFYGADRQGGESAWSEAVAAAIGLPIVPAPTQDLGMRIDALRIPMTTTIGPQDNALLIDPSCRFLKGGLAAHYKYKRQRSGTSDSYSNQPLKNAWSHPVEAAQYGVLGVRGRAGTINAAARAGRPGQVAREQRRATAPGDFNVFGV
jgi:hypothetical protein